MMFSYVHTNMSKLSRPCLRCLFSLLMITGLQGCISTVPSATSAIYDFGAFRGSAAVHLSSDSCALGPLHVADITSPSSLESDLMLYRLGYANDQLVHAYARHRWSMPPAQLLAQRIKTRLADSGVIIVDSGGTESSASLPSTAMTNTLQLRLELNDFTHYFSDPDHSQSQLTVRASLLNGSSLIAQTTLSQHAPSLSQDAAGGAKAMQEATDLLINELHGWLCAQARH